MKYQPLRPGDTDRSMETTIRSSSAYALAPRAWPGEPLLGAVQVQHGFTRGGPPSISSTITIAHVDEQGRAQLSRGRLLAEVSAIQIVTHRGDLGFVTRQPLLRALARSALQQAPQGIRGDDKADLSRRPEEFLHEAVVEACEFWIDGVRQSAERAASGTASLCRLRMSPDLVIDVAIKGAAPEPLELVELKDLTGLERAWSILAVALGAGPGGGQGSGGGEG